MKATVLNSFICKKDGKLKTVGSIVDYDKKRIEELSTAGFVSKTETELDGVGTKKK